MTSYGKGRWRRLNASEEEALVAAYRAGVGARQLAAEYGAHLRTVYRTIQRQSWPYVVVTAGDWRAEFALTAEGPVQRSPWYAA